MHGFVSRLQVLAGDVRRLGADDLLDAFDRLTDTIPEPTSRMEQLVVGELLRQALARLHAALGCSWIQVEPSRLSARTFRDAVQQVRTMRTSGGRTYLIQFHGVLARRYADHGLAAANVAAALNISSTHFIRLLKRHTGHGFPWHLHHARVTHARELLITSTYSIKEISGRVGYGHTSQLDRHFQNHYGATPSAYRRLHAADALRRSA